MNMPSKLATGTAVGVAGAYALAPDLTTLTMHYIHFSDALLPYDVIDAWTRTINAFWSVVVTGVGSIIAAYLPLTPVTPALPVDPASPEPMETPHAQS